MKPLRVGTDGGASELVQLAPEPEQDVVEAVRVALSRGAPDLDRTPSSYRCRWRVAALREGVEQSSSRTGYALSPRSTCGAARA